MTSAPDTSGRVVRPESGDVINSPCPVCDAPSPEPFLFLPDVPILSTEFHSTKEEAIAAPLGDLDLARCSICGIVWNVAFQSDKVKYTPNYENSQHFSASFRTYSEQLADRLTQLHDLDHSIIVEVGCGQAEFLTLLSKRAGSRGLGFDPTFDGVIGSEQVRVVKDYFDASVDVEPTLVMARHVLEHVDDPVSFLAGIRAAAPTAPAYYEVPNANYVFSEQGLWDLIYQHVSYFTPTAFKTALERSGYDHVHVHEAFHGQFLGADVADRPLPGRDSHDEGSLEESGQSIDSFADALVERIRQWSQLLRDRSGPVVLWGAGAKGVTFLNLMPEPNLVDAVVDINPRKAGRYVPGTGHVVQRPQELAGRFVERVLIMNSAYRGEIAAQLRDLGVSTNVDIV